MDVSERSSFGALLRQFRLARGLSQEALAERARLSVEAISALERGSRKRPQHQTLTLLADGLDLDADARERLSAAGGRRSSAPAPAIGPVHGPAPSRRQNFSRPLTRFVDRVTERPALIALLAAQRVVTLVGTGGVGKTRLAIEASLDVAERYADGVWLIELARLEDAALVLQELASALDVREAPDQPLLDVLIAALRERELLLVLDNCEHVIDDVARAIEAIVTACPRVNVLATSREALRIAGETVFRLPTLEVPAEGAVGGAEAARRFGAIELFVERGAALDPRFTLTDQNGPAIAAICRRLDGIPLALELAAATIPVLSIPQIAERLDERFRLLTGGRRTALPRQRTLRALIDWSFDLLTERERTVFCRLAILAGTWTLDAAVAVCAGGTIAAQDVPQLVIALVEKSLVVAEPDHDGEGRFHLLESTRAYAREQLVGRGDHADTAGRHAELMLGFARRAGSSVKEISETLWLERVEREIENVRAALDWTVAQGNDAAAGAEIATALGFFWESRRYHEGAYWLSSARASLDALQPQLAAKVLMETVRILPFTSQTVEMVYDALERYRSAGDAAPTYEALTYLGQTLINVGDYAGAAVALTEGIELARAADDRVALGRMLTILGFTHVYRDDVETALARFEEADALVRRSDRNVALLLRGFAEAAQLAGDGERAVAFARRALAHLEQLGNARQAGYARYHLAHALLAADQVAEARMNAVRAVDDLVGVELPLAFIEAVTVCAAVHGRMQDDRRCGRLLGFARSRGAVLPFRSALLIRRLRDDTLSALTTRLGAVQVQRLADQGAFLDDLQAAEEAHGS